MKSFKYIALVSIIAFAGCKKTIDLMPQSYLTVENFYTNYDEVNIALTGCYNGMQKPLIDEWTLTELRSDNVIQGVPGSTAAPNQLLNDLDIFVPSTSHQGVYNYWLSTYNNIRNTNLVLNALNVNYIGSTGTISYDNLTIPVTDAERKRLAAEAMFIRAYHYFNLVRLYGGVFLIHEPISPEDAKSINRESVANIYKLIEADLLNVIANGITTKYTAMVTSSPANIGRANAWCAKALLAKVYLTQNKKTEAAVLLQDVIINSGYSLQASYANVFSVSNEMNAEILFAVRYKSGGLGLGSPFANSFAPIGSGSAVVNGGGLGYDYPSSDLNNFTYASLDARKAVNIGVYGTGTAAKFYPKKYISPITIVNDAENDWPIIRFSDVLLMLAEAQGNTPASLAIINQTRTRAGLVAMLPAAVSTTAQFEDSLSRERKYEFAFENQRWFDIVRFNTTFSTQNAVQIMKDHFAKEYATHYAQFPSPPALATLQGQVNTNKLLLPIPQREIDNNTRIVIQQNLGY